MTTRPIQGSQSQSIPQPSFQIWDAKTGECITGECLSKLQPRPSRPIEVASSAVLGNGSVIVITQTVEIGDLTAAVQSAAEPILRKEPEKQELALTPCRNVGRAGIKRSHAAAELSPFAQKCRKVLRYTYRNDRMAGIKRSHAAAGLSPSSRECKVPRSADAPIALLPAEMLAYILLHLLKENTAASILSARGVCRNWSSCSQESFRIVWNTLKRNAPESPVDLKEQMQDIEQEMEKKGQPDDYFAHFKMLMAAMKKLNLEVGPLFLEPCQRDLIHSWEQQWEDLSLITMWLEAQMQAYNWDIDPSQPENSAELSSNRPAEVARRIRHWVYDPVNGPKLATLDADDLNLSLDGKIKIVPCEIGTLTAIWSLRLSGNELDVIPDAIGNLTELQELRMAENRLTSLPDAIGNLIRLHRLSVDHNRLASSPLSIGSLTLLRKLDLEHNQLGSLPEHILSLSVLRRLKIGHNGLTSLPESIGRLSQLRALWIDGNQLTSLPESIVSLRQLKDLVAQNNQLTSLPESIGRLSQLRALWIDGNQLTSLPESIRGLIVLKKFSIADNQLTSLPSCIEYLTSLKQLFLHNNQLTTIPNTVGKLTSLRDLSLRGNPLISLPISIGDLELQSLDIDDSLSQHRERQQEAYDCIIGLLPEYDTLFPSQEVHPNSL